MIEGFCGVLTWQGLSSVVSGLGTLVAAVTAAVIYWKNRQNQKEDLAMRRTILHRMLLSNLRPEIKKLQWHLKAFDDLESDENRFKIFAVSTAVMHPRSVERLAELQDELVTLGRKGDEKIAEFIEVYRSFDLELKNLEYGVGEGKGDKSDLVFKLWSGRIEAAARKAFETLKELNAIARDLETHGIVSGN
jgi:hypothetical protein